MSTDSLKTTVVKSYGQLAKMVQENAVSKIFDCCSPTKTTDQVGEKIGYSQAELQSVPENANLGVGCGNPSALTNILEGQTVIDLGSGAGFDAFLVADKVGIQGKVIGVDLSKDMLDLARRNAKKGDFTMVQFIEGDIENLPLEDGIADHVISNCVINLSLHKEEVFREAFRVLKFGGRLVISDVVLEKELPAFLQDSLAGHIACVSGAEKLDAYLQHIEAAGFVNVTVEQKKQFPVELMLTDPQLKQIAHELEFDLNGDEVEDIAAHVCSVTISADKV